MSDFLTEIFEWVELFDNAVTAGREAGKTKIVVKAPKTTKEVQLKVVTKAGHIVTNPKSKKNWTIKIDAKKNELRGIRTTVVSLK